MTGTDIYHRNTRLRYLFKISIAQAPTMLTKHDTHLRMMAAKALKMKGKVRMQSLRTILQRLDAAKD